MIHYEDLVRDPEYVMTGLCRFLRLDFEPSLLEPYSGDRMTKGDPSRFRSVGDPNFHNHTAIDILCATLGRKSRYRTNSGVRPNKWHLSFGTSNGDGTPISFEFTEHSVEALIEYGRANRVRAAATPISKVVRLFPARFRP